MTKPLKDSFPGFYYQPIARGLDETILDVRVEDHLKQRAVDHLPQAKILANCLNHLTNYDDVQEAYLRGSFFTGVADEHSDIDLFLVVKPDDLEQTYKNFVEFMQNHSTPVVFGCHDRLAADYGGVGFMFICQKSDGELFQFDLYTALKGTPPKEGLPCAPRIFSRDSSYCWKHETSQTAVPSESTRNFIERHTQGLSTKEKMELLYKELAITLFVMSKHLKRGQVMRSLDMNNHAIGVCIEMVQEIKGIDTYQAPLYAADAIINKYENDPDKRISHAVTTLKDCGMEVPSIAKAEKIFGVGRDLLEVACPDVHSRLEPAMNVLKQKAFVTAQQQGQKFTKPLITPSKG